MSLCSAKTKQNNDCDAQAMREVSYCYRHNPAIPESDKLKASKSGGKSKSVLTNVEPVRLRDIDSIVKLVESNISAVRTGELDYKVSNAVVQNLNVLLKVYELAAVDSRVRRLEQRAGIESPSELISMGVTK